MGGQRQSKGQAEVVIRRGRIAAGCEAAASPAGGAPCAAAAEGAPGEARLGRGDSRVPPGAGTFVFRSPSYCRQYPCHTRRVILVLGPAHRLPQQWCVCECVCVCVCVWLLPVCSLGVARGVRPFSSHLSSLSLTYLSRTAALSIARAVHTLSQAIYSLSGGVWHQPVGASGTRTPTSHQRVARNAHVPASQLHSLTNLTHALMHSLSLPHSLTHSPRHNLFLPHSIQPFRPTLLRG
jgi:hypothetical protein